MTNPPPDDTGPPPRIVTADFAKLQASDQRARIYDFTVRTFENTEQIMSDIAREGQETRDKIAELRLITTEAIQRLLDRNGVLQQIILDKDAIIASKDAALVDTVATAQLLDAEQVAMDADIARLKTVGVEVTPPAAPTKPGGA